MIRLELNATDEQAEALGLDYFDTDDGYHWTKDFDTIEKSREFRRKHDLELLVVWVIEEDGSIREYSPEGQDRPKSREDELAEALEAYTDPNHPEYDADFHAKIRERQPHWFDADGKLLEN